MKTGLYKHDKIYMIVVNIHIKLAMVQQVTALFIGRHGCMILDHIDN